MRRNEPKTVQKAVRLPATVWADIEWIYENTSIRFANHSDCIRYLLEEAIFSHLPAEVLAERQAAIAKKVFDQEQARLDEQDAGEIKKAG